jgi:GxxExxY protein
MESVYAAALERELRKAGLQYSREVRVPVYYDGEAIAWQRLDFLVEQRVVLELKSMAKLSPNCTRQLFSYLKATRLRVGLLLHYGDSARVHRVYCEHAHKSNSSQDNQANQDNRSSGSSGSSGN